MRWEEEDLRVTLSWIPQEEDECSGYPGERPLHACYTRTMERQIEKNIAQTEDAAEG